MTKFTPKYFLYNLLQFQAISKLFLTSGSLYQGTLTEGEDSVQLTSLLRYLYFQKSKHRLQYQKHVI